MRMQRKPTKQPSAFRRPSQKSLLIWGLLLSVSLLWGQWTPNVLAQSTALSDTRISQAVTDALVQDPGVNAALVDVETSDGVVTVSGSVNNILAKERATHVAEAVKGARAVVNTIDVAAPLRSDTEIQQDIEDAWLRDPATESYELSVTVNNGVATLTGTVDSWQEKQLSARVAKGVRGVKGILNNIDVSYDEERTDYEIKSEIQSALRWDALVDDSLITVDVENGTVMLTGTVGSAAEKARARADAWVTGVTSVGTDDLQVASWARDERFREDKYVDKTDADIAEAVEDALLYDPRVASFEVNVSVDNGVVRLSGDVDNLRAKRSAAQTAQNVVGVWRVKNNITVRPHVLSDKTVEDKVENALLTDPYIERYEITVTVRDNEVYMYGDVDTFFEKAQAEDIASNISGVIAVHNHLDVEEVHDAYTYDPYVDEWYPYDYDWNAYMEDYKTVKSDWEIKQDIVDELYWSPFVDSDEVTVRVDDGEAKLTGTVDTMDEREAAEKNAYDGGAVSVDNDLTVQYGPDYYEP